MLEIGSLVDGKYKILNKVGQGGMSVVYLAMNEKANKQWAVKEVRKDGVLDFEAVKQGLVAETDILKKLDHPNLPSIIDVIDTADSFIIIMDYIQGNSLNKALDEYGAQPQDLVIEWSKQLCDVLGYLHSRTPAIIYRDMKPSNVMLKPDGNVTLIDFGTAREYKEKNVADTTCLGTVGYAAPEQFGGMGQTDARTDIYCLGATMYHLVTGMNPCQPPYEILPIRQINPALSSGLEKIIIKCTQRNPDDRYQSCAELMYALEHYDEIDDYFIGRQKKKLATFITTSALALVFGATSIFGYVAADKANTANYEILLDEADIETDEALALDMYYDAMFTDPSRPDAYSRLNKYLVSDYLLDSDEAKVLDQIRIGLDRDKANGNTETVKVLDKLKAADPEAYMDVYYEIGESFLYYYKTGNKDRYTKSAVWFKEAVGDKYPMADIYCKLADSLNQADKYQTKDQIDNMYSEYEALLELLKDLNEQVDNADGKDIKLQVWGVVNNVIELNLNNLCDMGKKDELISMLEAISEKAQSKEINTEALKNKVSTLVGEINTTINKINSKTSN